MSVQQLQNQIQRDVIKLVEGGIAASVLSMQGMVVLLAVYVYW